MKFHMRNAIQEEESERMGQLRLIFIFLFASSWPKPNKNQVAGGQLRTTGSQPEVHTGQTTVKEILVQYSPFRKGGLREEGGTYSRQDILPGLFIFFVFVLFLSAWIYFFSQK